MKGKKLLGVVVSLALLVLTLGVASVSSQASTGVSRIVSIRGITKVEGQDAVVEILVAVHPGENASEKARAVLRRVYPDVRPLDSSDYSLTGLVWDVFSDTNSGNDKVLTHYNPSGVPANLVNPKISWLASQATWTDVPSSVFVYEDGGDTGRCPSLVRECPGPQKFDGNNDVGWLAINEPDVLGVTWYGTQTDEFDMVLDNADFTWYVGEGAIPSGAIDTQTVWLHEFGHGAGLGHSAIEQAVMFAYYGGVRRSLNQDDIDGITALYPAGEPTPTPVPGETMSVTDITYTRYGGKTNNRHLQDTLTVKDNNLNAVAGATVSITLSNDSGGSWNGTGTTDTQGIVVFTLKNAPQDCYTTEVNSVTAGSLQWVQTPIDYTSC